MEWILARTSLLGRSLALLATWAIVFGGASVMTNLGGIADGEFVAISRAIIGVWGVMAGLLVWTLRSAGIDGWQALMVWAIVQLPVIAWSSAGSPTTQLFDFPLGVTSSTTVNGVQTQFEQYGVNLVAVALCIWTSKTRDRWERRIKPEMTQPDVATSAA